MTEAAAKATDAAGGWLSVEEQAAWLEGSGLFDADWYLARHDWRGEPPAAPALHYLTAGGLAGLRPNPLFDSAWYLATNADVRGSGMNPLLHYLRSGAAEGRRPSVLFGAPPDPGAALGGENALARFLAGGWRDLASPHPLFAPRWYLDRYPAVARQGLNPLWHYLSEGDGEGLRPHPLFDPAWYLLSATQARAGGRAALEHYVESGWRQGASPHPLFDSAFYLQLYPDIAAAGMDPLLHFLNTGAGEGRQPHPLFDLAWYVEQAPAGLAPGDNPLLHYLERGAALGCDPSPEFDSAWYLSAYPEVAAAGCSPLEHYVTQGRARGYRTRPPVGRLASRAWLRPAGESAVPGVNLVGPVGFVNGLATSARGFADCLSAAGCRLNVVPWERDFAGSDRLEPPAYPRGETQPINLIHLNLDLLTQSRLLRAPELQRLMRPGRYNILVPYWELAALEPVWAPTLAAFDEIWCASGFMARAFRAATDRPVRVVRPALAPRPPAEERARAALGLPEGRFLFAYLADASSGFGRKNPLGLARAYAEAFAPEEGAACLLKVGYAGQRHPALEELRALAAARPDIVLLEGMLEDALLADLYGLIDCYVSPHRAEGLGLTVIEAMAAGKPVIATRYGGVEDFVSPATALVVEHDLVEVGPGNAPYGEGFVWAEPRPAALRARLREVFDRPRLARSLGARGRAEVERLFSRETTALAAGRELRRIWSGAAA